MKLAAAIPATLEQNATLLLWQAVPRKPCHYTKLAPLGRFNGCKTLAACLARYIAVRCCF
jgi:hypothetical protein